MTSANGALLTALRDGLARIADRAKAPGMQSYMKSAMPYLGVTAPVRRAFTTALFAEHPITGRAQWEATVRALWHEATYREEWYAAVDLTGHRAYRGWQDPDLVGLYEELVVAGAWWDVVDEIATHRVGTLLTEHRSAMRPVVLGWSVHEHLWLRRTSILCQTRFRERTDTELLAACIEPSIGDRDFFARKAIGWALREYGKTDPGWVRAFVDSHPELSGLSRRVALRRLEPRTG